MHEPAPLVMLDDRALVPILRAALAEGGEFHLAVSGSSMQPTLYPNRDAVTLAAAPERLRRGDLPLYRRDSGKLVLHRVVAVSPDGSYVMCGDHQFRTEPGVRPDQILALTVRMTRKGRELPVDALRVRLWVGFWLRALPLRRLCFRAWGLLRRLLRRG